MNENINAPINGFFILSFVVSKNVFRSSLIFLLMFYNVQYKKRWAVNKHYRFSL
jgi:hypothetical protein